MKLTDLSDAQLLESLRSLVGQGRAVLARLLAHLVEVDERRLHLEAACPSMFQFCVQRLGLSEDEACRRIHAARLARRFPDLIARIERGELTLSTMAVLHDALTPANYAELVEAAAGKTKAEVQALLAKRSPMPDVPAAITAIPTQPPIPSLGVVNRPAPAASGGPQLAPLSESRHKVQFEKQRLGRSSRPREPREHETEGISRATRRAVFERDGERCTFTDADGHRCPATTWLELDHVVPRARGGTSDLGNLRVRCRAHNLLYAEQVFGRQHVERKIRERRPRKRGYTTESCELAASGLAGMGFRPPEVRRALEAVSVRHPREVLAAIPVQIILREALAVLT
jgi:5-methylcytosine-specific restriction endonuclease McrA